MQAVLDLPKTTAKPITTVRKVIDFAVAEKASATVSGVSWETYKEIVRQFWGKQSPRFFYEKGSLLIMPTSSKHEDFNRVIASFIEICCLEWEINWRNFGSATFDRDDLERGFEPDSCFYFKNEPAVRDREQLDMEHDPPPDLILEVDITSPSTGRETTFAAFGVPEIWRFEKGKMHILRLKGKKYAPVPNSFSLPPVSAEILTEFVAESKSSRLEWLKKVREWARTAKS